MSKPSNTMTFSAICVFVVAFAAPAVTAFLPLSSVRCLTGTSRSVEEPLQVSSAPSFLGFLLPSHQVVESPPRPPDMPPPFSMEPEVIIGRFKAFLASDLGVRDPSMLSDDFLFIGPDVAGTGPLTKAEYIAAGQFFNLRRTFPDLDYRAHDFRIVEQEDESSNPKTVTVRCTSRTVGTMRGVLRLRTESIEPNGKRMICPPETISITMDATTGLVVKLYSGFVMDRLVGNTKGLSGVMAAASIAEAPPSEWEIYPPTVVISRFFGRSVKQLPLEPPSILAPFPEQVMVSLAKGVLASDYGVKDPALLSEKFTFCSPYVGPISKETFLLMSSKFIVREILPNVAEEFTNFRVDPYDPYRVWVDLKANGTGIDGMKYYGPPEAVSVAFDDEGFCTRLTSGAVIDPTECNTGGLGGIDGALYAIGKPLSPFSSRPLPQILSRALKALTKPFTGYDVDDFIQSKSPKDSKIVEVDNPPKRPDVPIKLETSAPSDNLEVGETVPIIQKDSIDNSRSLKTDGAILTKTKTKAKSKDLAMTKKTVNVAPSKKKEETKISTSATAKKKSSGAPKGVPVLKQWKKGRDNSITGFIYGSKSFNEGASVTTSQIVSGTFAAGNVVTSSSGSKYFLN